MKIPVLICDDNINSLNNLEKMLIIAEEMLDENEKGEEIRLVITKTTSYQEAYDYVKNSKSKNGVFFLDIELSANKFDNSGIDLAEKIRLNDKNSKIVFVTNYEDMAFLTYKRRIGAVDYIIKSFNTRDMQKRLNETLENIVSNYSINQEKKHISYKLGTRIINLNLSKLYYIETSTMPHKLDLVKDSGISYINGSLNSFEKEYSDLLRISQSCLINPENVIKINFSENSVTFPNGDRLRYSRKMRNYMRKWQNRNSQ